MKKSILSVFIFCFCASYAQYKNQAPVVQDIATKEASLVKINYTFQNIENENEINGFLLKNFPEKEFVFSYKKESPGGVHFYFNQVVNGVPIYFHGVKLNIQKSGRVINVLENTIATKDMQILASQPFNVSFEPAVVVLKKEAILFPQNEDLLAATLVETQAKNKVKTETIYFDNIAIFERKKISYLAQDSVATAMVFNPDPITTAHATYSGSYVDNNDATNTALNNARFSKPINLTFENGLFVLKNQYFEFNDLDGGVSNDPQLSTPVFDFTRFDDEFEYCNAYYHINFFRDYINAKGFQMGNTIAYVDPHSGGPNNDNSAFIEPDQLEFGDGGIDDAEDADVLVHEFSHFLSYQASPNGNFGNQRAALDEAFGDYFATSYSRSIDSFNWKKMFSWDGNATWTGRIVQGTKKYPTDVVSTDIYATSAIISQCLNDIWTDIGRGATDSIVLQSLYLTTSNINLPAYGQLLLDADTLLTNGRYTCPISRRLVERGLLSSNRCNVGFETLNDSFSSQLFYTTNGFVIDTDLENISIEIYSIDGKKMNSFKNQKVVNTQNFAQGMYVVSIKSNNYERNLKYLKN